MVNIQTYTVAQHRFTFASWAAATAARQSPLCRFSVKFGVGLLENAVLKSLSESPLHLPEARDFDAWHRDICNGLLTKARAATEGKDASQFTYGVIAKLVNCYLKGLFTINVDLIESELPQQKVNAIHPPIDRLLIAAIYELDADRVRRKFWLHNMSWSKFDELQYFEVIDRLREFAAPYDLWRVEAYWSGFQDSGVRNRE
jgi:hypothetical protein